jgi:heterodisulfide reductase subunit D
MNKTLESDPILSRIVEDFQVYHCVECGKCTGACPLAQVDRDFSPRLLARHIIEEGLQSEYVREKAWTCLTCGLCNQRCPVGISFTEFVRALRPLYVREDHTGYLSHGGALQGLMRMQSVPRLVQNRLDWITPDLRISSQGETLYFVGCLPYFETFFSDLNVSLVKIAVDTVRILNSLGIEPVVLANERCCGHDLIWTGDEGSFQKLRHLNIESFETAGAKTIITACAECSYVLKHLYPDASEPFPFEVIHLTEYLEKVDVADTKRLNKTATYQDPCRLGRLQGVYDEPRELLGSILELREMAHFGAGAWCCGNSSWLHCDRYSKQMQVERLLEAKGTRADLIITACPKCQVHLTCAMRDINRLGDLHLKIQDISSVIAKSIEFGRSS